jgi:hypothetical protein
MKGKTVMFVGDSLGRNQWESLICMISTAAPTTQTQLVRGDPLSTFKFLVSTLSLSLHYLFPDIYSVIIYFYDFNKFQQIKAKNNVWYSARPVGHGPQVVLCYQTICEISWGTQKAVSFIVWLVAADSKSATHQPRCFFFFC